MSVSSFDTTYIVNKICSVHTGKHCPENSVYVYDRLMDKLSDFIKSDSSFNSTTRCTFSVISNYPDHSVNITVMAKDTGKAQEYHIDLVFPCMSLEDQEHPSPLELL